MKGGGVFGGGGSEGGPVAVAAGGGASDVCGAEARVREGRRAGVGHCGSTVGRGSSLGVAVGVAKGAERVVGRWQGARGPDVREGVVWGTRAC